MALAALAERAGVPKGEFNVITEASAATGAELTSTALVPKLSFTGSTEIGRKLLEQCARTSKRTSTELGGTDCETHFAMPGIGDAATASRK